MCASRTGVSGFFGRRIWTKLPPYDPGGAHFFWVTKGRAREMVELKFLKFDYYLDESDPDIVILRRQDSSLVARFSA
jgi:hypothetical protein